MPGEGLEELQGHEVERDVGLGVGVEDDEVVWARTAQEGPSVGDVDVEAGVVGDVEVLPRHPDDLGVDLDDVHGDPGVVLQELLGTREAAAAYEEDALYAGVEDEAHVEVVCVLEDGAVGAVEVGCAVGHVVQVEDPDPPARLVDDGEGAVGRVLLVDDVPGEDGDGAPQEAGGRDEHHQHQHEQGHDLLLPRQPHEGDGYQDGA
ncbi:hypothetical protein ES703_81598 [subsurface metagenome]